MTERQNGLRFDIYERVHLADNTVGVKELDEVELVPHIQVYTEGEQALLKGNLYLTGQYTGDNGDGSRTLEHLIPVEITLPLNRIQDVRDVSVEIDNFDVDLLTPRSLNVTGVLTLNGIEMLSAPEEPWREEEETVFVHKAEAFGDLSPVRREEPSLESYVQSYAEAQENRQALDPWASTTAGSAAAADESRRAPVEREPLVSWDSQELQRAEATLASQEGLSSRNEETEAPEAQKAPGEIYVNADAAEEEAQEVFASQPDEPLSSVAVQETAETVPAAVQEEPVKEEKKELKIAFGSKIQESAYNLKSMLHKGDTRSAAAQAVEEPAAEAAAPRTDSLEWKRLFVRGESDSSDSSFKKLRVCIVQKDESLSTIAERYNINSRELLLYNRIAEEDLSEGKVLIIPRV